MQDQQSGRRIPLGIVAGISAAVLAAAGGGIWLAWNSQQPSTQPTVTTRPQPLQQTPAVQPSVAAEQKVEVYWLRDTGKNLEVVPSQVTVKAAGKPEKALKEAFNSLLTGAKDPSMTSTIPQGTKLRSVRIKDNGVHVDLSKEFTTGGGSTSMTGRMAQVLYTATSLNPNAKVWIEVEGQKLEVLGGEGLEIDQPLTRKNFKANFQI